MTSNLAEQTQKYTDGPDSEIVGDCWRTAIACLLEIPRDEVPHFMQLTKDSENTNQWWLDTLEFVEEYTGMRLAFLHDSFPIYTGRYYPARCIVTAMSPRGPWRHAVLADSDTGKMVWDPYPGATDTIYDSSDDREVFALVPNN